MISERDEERLTINIDDRDFRRTPFFRRNFAAHINDKRAALNLSIVEDFALAVNALKPLRSSVKEDDSEKSCKRYLVEWEKTQSAISKDNMLLFLDAAGSSPQELVSYLHEVQKSATKSDTDASDKSESIPSGIIDFTRFIDDWTEGFVGREFVFDAIDRFLLDNDRGYFLLRGDPGIGKTAIAAQIVKTRGYIYHFNIRAEGINRVESFLQNIRAQLIAAYGLDPNDFPIGSDQGGTLLKRLIEQVAQKIDDTDKAVIVIDALDEADRARLQLGENVLYLPTVLTERVYIIATLRRESIPLRIDCEQQQYIIKHDDPQNKADIINYLEMQTRRPGIQSYLNKHRDSPEEFVTVLASKSEGNFMYLRYVLPEIEGGAYTLANLDSLPAGLTNYYEDHWKRMRGIDETAWFKYKLPVIAALTVSKSPVSIDLLSRFAQIEQRARVVDVLEDWRAFIHKGTAEFKEKKRDVYSLYHSSFYDFVASKDQVKEEHVNLRDAQKKIADDLWSSYYGKRRKKPNQ